MNKSCTIGICCGLLSLAAMAEPDARGIVVNGERTVEVERRTFVDGEAVRYRLPEGRRFITSELTEWTLPEDARVWFQAEWQGGIYYELPYTNALVRNLPVGLRMAFPVTAKLADGTYRLITEANVVDYTDGCAVFRGNGRFGIDYYADTNGFEQVGAATTPWRVMLVAKDLQTLATSDIVRRLCPPPSAEVAAKCATFVKPGRAVWHWLPSGPPVYEEQQDWYDRTKALGFEYYLIDDGWKCWRDGNLDQWACLKKWIDYGKSIGVETFMWVDSKEMLTPEARRTYLAQVKASGAVGIKIDFMPLPTCAQMKWYEETLTDTLALGLMTDFHGCVKPSGRERTWPHEVAREAIRGHEWHITRYRRILPPEHDCILPFNRLIQGHADYTPVVFEPKELCGYTWARELAQGIVFSAPFLCLGDHPKNYQDNPAVGVVRSLPAVYDEVRILPGSEIGECIAVAKRKGKDWFVAIENGATARQIQITFTFLGEGTYSIESFADVADDPAAYVRASVEVSKQDVRLVPLVPGGGFVAVLRPKDTAFELVSPEGAATIVLATNAVATSRHAVEELVRYVEKATGRQPEVKVRGEGERRKILIGTLDAFPGAVPEEARAALAKCRQYEAAWTGVKDGTLYFVGKEPMGELYAVYRFLEKYLDIRWFTPPTKDDPGEYVPPRRKTLSIPSFVECREPDFAQRMLLEVCSRQGSPATNGMDCVIRNGWQAMPGLWPYSRQPGRCDEARRYHEARMNPRQRNNGGGHCLFEDAIPKSEFAAHPEYFALVKGERVKGEMYCMSNPEVRQRVADHLIAANASCGGQGFAILELADYESGNCECAACRAMDGADGAKAGRSLRFFTVMNDIKSRVRKVRPAMRFMSYAYQDYRKMPSGVEIDPNDLILYCTHGRSMVNPIDDPVAPENVRQFAEAREWKAKIAEVGMREYMTCSHINYRPVEYLLAKDLKTYRASGLAGLWEEMIYTDSPMQPEYAKEIENRERQVSSWRYFYVAGHMLWNADLEVEALLDDAHRKFYGPAYPAMKKYHDLRHQVWEKTPGKYGYCVGDDRTALLLGVGDTQDRLFACLTEAEKLIMTNAALPHSDQTIYRSRIAADRHFLNEYWVKPHEVLGKLKDKTLRAPTRTGAGWNAAHYESNFQLMANGFPVAGKFAPAELRTQVGLLSDAEHLYFRLIAREPATGQMKLTKEKDGPVWNDDGFELFVFPPSAENAYAHLAVNALGTVYDARCPGNKVEFDYGVKAVGTIEKDRYVIDVTVPTEKLMAIRPGDVWRVGVMRRRTIQDALTPDGNVVWSLHGVRKHQPAWMASLEFGSANCIVNGSFENGTKGWGKPRLASVENGMALKLLANECMSGYFTGDLRRGPVPKPFRWTFRAKGKGHLRCVRAAFTDTPDNGEACGYKRTMHPLFTLAEAELTSEWRTFSGTSETLPDAQNGIRFQTDAKATEIFVDDVSVVPADCPIVRIPGVEKKSNFKFNEEKGR